MKRNYGGRNLLMKDVSDKRWLKDTDQREHKEASNRFVAGITLILLVVLFIIIIPTVDAVTTAYIACESLVDMWGEE